MREAEFRALVIKMLAPLCAFPVENAVHDGTPDVCCSPGWIELKRGTIPRRLGSPVVVHMRDSQRAWHRLWRRTGARSWTLTLFDLENPGARWPGGREMWALHDGRWAAERLGLAPEPELTTEAVMYWTTRPGADELIRAIIGTAQPQSKERIS